MRIFYLSGDHSENLLLTLAEIVQIKVAFISYQ